MAVSACGFRFFVESLSKKICRLRVVPHFSSGIVKRVKRRRAWKSPHACRLSSRGWFHARLRFARSIIPEEKWGTTVSLKGSSPLQFLLVFFAYISVLRETCPCWRCRKSSNWSFVRPMPHPPPPQHTPRSDKLVFSGAKEVTESIKH